MLKFQDFIGPVSCELRSAKSGTLCTKFNSIFQLVVDIRGRTVAHCYQGITLRFTKTISRIRRALGKTRGYDRACPRTRLCSLSFFRVYQGSTVSHSVFRIFALYLVGFGSYGTLYFAIINFVRWHRVSRIMVRGVAPL